MKPETADYWNDLGRKLRADPHHLEREFVCQFTAIACPKAPEPEPTNPVRQTDED